jgi:hypothetical protein
VTASLFQLSLKPGTLTGGIIYALTLHGSYVSTETPTSAAAAAAAAYASISVTPNAPPRGGELQVTPTSGVAVLTSFYIATSNWIDDSEDYPLSYVLSYYSYDDSQKVVKSLDTVPYAEAVMGQGDASRGYRVTCIATALDYFGSAASSDASITVTPIAVGGTQIERFVNQTNRRTSESNNSSTRAWSGLPLPATTTWTLLFGALEAGNGGSRSRRHGKKKHHHVEELKRILTIHSTTTNAVSSPHTHSPLPHSLTSVTSGTAFTTVALLHAGGDGGGGGGGVEEQKW